jgi:hypothetical protein
VLSFGIQRHRAYRQRLCERKLDPLTDEKTIAPFALTKDPSKASFLIPIISGML